MKNNNQVIKKAASYIAIAIAIVGVSTISWQSYSGFYETLDKRIDKLEIDNAVLIERLNSIDSNIKEIKQDIRAIKEKFDEK